MIKFLNIMKSIIVIIALVSLIFNIKILTILPTTIILFIATSLLKNNIIKTYGLYI